MTKKEQIASIAANQRVYYQVHRETRLKYQKEYRARNKDKIKAYNKAYRESSVT